MATILTETPKESPTAATDPIGNRGIRIEDTLVTISGEKFVEVDAFIRSGGFRVEGTHITVPVPEKTLKSEAGETFTAATVPRTILKSNVPGEKTHELETGRRLTATAVSRETPGSRTRKISITTTGPGKLLRSKTRETLGSKARETPTTTTVPRKILERETRDVKKDKEKMTQSSWQLTYGRRGALELFEESMTFIVYEKKISKAITPLSKNSPRDLDTKKVSERQKQQLLKIVLCRTEMRGIENLKNLAGYSGCTLSPLLVSTGKRPLTVFMLFGDGHQVDKTRSEKGWEPFDNGFLALNRATNIPLDHYTHHFSFPPWDLHSKEDESWKNAQQVAKFLKKLGSLDTDRFLGITTGGMSQSLCKSLFDTLNKQGWFNTEDCTFLKEIVPFRKQPEDQMKLLSDRVQFLVTEPVPDHKGVIAITKKIHQLSRQKAYKRGTSSVYMDENGMIEVNLIDDCHTAYKLGRHLKEKGLLADAVEAFKILTDEVNVVEKIDNVSIKYHSFYADKARSEIERFEKSSITSSCTIDSEDERLREKIIKENLTGLVQGGDVNIDLLLNSLETYCGPDLLKDVDKKGKHEEVLSKIMLKMAHKICQQQGELILLQGERKERAEIEAVQTKPVCKASGGSLSKSLTVETSREEDDEDDDDFPPVPTFSPSILFAYSQQNSTGERFSLPSNPETPSTLKKSRSSPYCGPQSSLT